MAETFGKTDQGNYNIYQKETELWGCKYQSGDAGSLENIKVYLKEVTAAVDCKCAIYDSNKNLVANGQTEEKSIGVETDEFITFNFGASKPEVAASSDYWLCFWTTEVNKICLRYDVGAVDQAGKDTDQSYDSWPNSFNPSSYSSYEISIYATYYEAPPPPPAAKTLVQVTLI